MIRPASILALVAFACVAGCSSTPLTAYTPQSSATRDTTRADQLNGAAAEFINSDPAKAESLLRGALAADLFHGPAHNNLGVLYLKQGKLYDAAGEFEWARKLLPGHPDPRLNLSLVFEAAGRSEEALAHVNAALQVQPGHIASIQQRARLLIALHDGHSPLFTHRDQVVTDLRDIAFRGESATWKYWAREQVIRWETSP